MSKEKQIEEMAFNLIMATSPLGVKDLTKQFDYKTVATDLYELYGWRKASEVAEEIFAEIEKKVKASLTIHLEEINKEHIKDTPLYDRHSEIIFALRQIEDFLAELKKKYTKEITEEGK